MRNGFKRDPVRKLEVINDKDHIMQIVERNPEFDVFLRKCFMKEKLV